MSSASDTTATVVLDDPFSFLETWPSINWAHHPMASQMFHNPGLMKAYLNRAGFQNGAPTCEPGNASSADITVVIKDPFSFLETWPSFNWDNHPMASQMFHHSGLMKVYLNRSGFQNGVPSEPAPPRSSESSRECVICQDDLIASPATPVAYLENCSCLHAFHPGCIIAWFCNDPRCPNCRAYSPRVLLWPTWFNTDHEMGVAFQAQKRGLGLKVASDTFLWVMEFYPGYLKINLDGKTFWVRNYPLNWYDDHEPAAQTEEAAIDLYRDETLGIPIPSLQTIRTALENMKQNPETEILQPSFKKYQQNSWLFQWALRRMEHEEEAASLMNLFPPLLKQDHLRCYIILKTLVYRRKLVGKFECPIQDNVAAVPAGKLCSFSLTEICPFHHSKKEEGAEGATEGKKYQKFPSSLCLGYSLSEDVFGYNDYACLKGSISSKPDELSRCPEGYHLSTEDLANFGDSVEQKIAKQDLLNSSSASGSIISAISSGATSNRCFLCKSDATSQMADGRSSLWTHLQKCDHPFHYDCFEAHVKTLGQEGSSLKSIDCPFCNVPSTRSLVWPHATFTSTHQKKGYLKEQSKNFHWHIATQKDLLLIEEEEEEVECNTSSDHHLRWLRISSQHGTKRVNLAQIQEDVDIWLCD